MSFLKSTVVYAALVVAGVGLSGCAVQNLLDKISNDNGSGGGSTLRLGNAVSARVNLECTVQAGTDNCNQETVKITGVTTKYPVKATLTKTVTKASVTLEDGIADVQNLVDVPVDPDSGGSLFERETETATSEKSESVELESPVGDEFFTFVDAQSHSVVLADGKFSSVADRTLSVVGTKTAVDKLKTATFKGQGELSGGFVKLGSHPDTGGNLDSKGDLELSANLSAKTISGGITNLQSVEGEDAAHASIVGGSLELLNGQIVDNQFGGGKLVLKNAAGVEIIDFAETSTFTGGFYGEDMDFAAGVLQGNKVKGEDLYFVGGTFWGAQEPAPAAANQ